MFELVYIGNKCYSNCDVSIMSRFFFLNSHQSRVYVISTMVSLDIAVVRVKHNQILSSQLEIVFMLSLYIKI